MFVRHIIYDTDIHWPLHKVLKNGSFTTNLSMAMMSKSIGWAINHKVIGEQQVFILQKAEKQKF